MLVHWGRPVDLLSLIMDEVPDFRWDFFWHTFPRLLLFLTRVSLLGKFLWLHTSFLHLSLSLQLVIIKESIQA